ncbi:MAG: UTP--glucose-1-phosphate uridylyltransferase [Pseudomonadota bacterium]
MSSTPTRLASVRTAIFPVAGLGTRFLPATKTTPKELLPVLDTPLIQYAIDEARSAGIERLVFVSHPSKAAIERHVMDDRALRETLLSRGKGSIADKLKASSFDSEDDVVFVMQDAPLGLGHAVLCARNHVLPGPVAVLLPDDLILGQKGCIAEMIEAYGRISAGHLVATSEVERSKTGAYGILDVRHRTGPVATAKGIVEKPAPDKAPSTTAVVGRYVLDASIFEDLATQAPGAGGEIQLTDAIANGIPRTGLAGFSFSGTRFDCGSKAGMLKATLHVARQDPECHAALLELSGSDLVTAA